MTSPTEERVAEGVARGLLPRQPPVKSWAGRGTGQVCDGCGAAITPADVEYELDFEQRAPVRLHAACLEVWRRLIAA